MSSFEIARGHPLPFGATILPEGVNFAVYSSSARSLSLLLFAPGSEEPLAECPLDPRYNKTGHVWHALLRGLDTRLEYAFCVDGGPPLVDPYARSLAGGGQRCRILDADGFDWRLDQPLDVHLADSIIYELHVGGFTRHPSSGVAHPGTYLGVIEKIPHLLDLGVTTVELMPINQFDRKNTRRNPETGESLVNYWGYSSVGFFAAHAGYAAEPGNELSELKLLVRELHAAGIEVIVDMVFNHTSEGEEDVHSLRGLDEATYYMRDENGELANYAGCGNTVNCNHPVVRDLVLDSLRYWVSELHVDGFRFDLASVLGRGPDGEVLANPPLIERITADPVLAGSKLIAEAWDAAGLYQVGSFPHWGRWAEWNGRYRDDLRRWLKSDGGQAPALASRLLGSADLYAAGRAPFHGINFITCHDGFTLNDLVTYSHKHNLGNGEKDRDGTDDNLSWNCGEEGPTTSPEIRSLRARQRKNAAALLLLSQGVPMILAGDELGRTQRGNNNAWCQDNEISWIDWGHVDGELHRFFRSLIHFRKRHPILRQRNFEARSRFVDPDWSWESRSLMLQLEDLLLILHAHWEPRRFELPGTWRRVVDTAQPSPFDFIDEADAPAATVHEAAPRSVAVFVMNG